MRTILFFILSLNFIFLACNPKMKDSKTFIHTINKDPKPWNSELFEEGEEDFNFAIISDLNGGERKGVFDIAVQQINRINPEFVLSIGDLIDGGTEDYNKLKAEWDSFDDRAAEFEMPFFHLGGNHDLTNPKMREFWKNRFGPRYYHFIYKNVLFLMIDSEDFEEKRMMEVYNARSKALQVINGEIEGEYTNTEYYNMQERKTGAISDAQFQYFANILEKYQDVKWTFLLMHKPIWQRKDKKGLQRLENILNNRPYTVFNGHLHSFSHRKRNGNDYIILGTTGGSQNENDQNAFDHFTYIRMTKEKPVITHLRMDGVLDETGSIPLQGDTISFQRSKK